MRTTSFVVVPLLGIASMTLAQTPADGWTGQVQCVIVADAPTAGYRDEQTHTWVVTGPPTLRNDFRDYPVTWTVTGSGSRTPPPPAGAAPGPSDTWNRTGTASGTLTLFMPKGTKGLRIAGGQQPLKALGGISGATASLRAGASTPIAGDADEWRFQYIDVTDTARAELTGTRTQARTDLAGWRQPAGASVSETCTWNLAQGKPLTSAVSSQSAATATVATTSTTSTTLKLGPAGGTASGVIAPSTPATPAGTTAGSKTDKSLRGREGDIVDLSASLRLEWTQPIVADSPTPTIVSGGSAALILTVSNAGPGVADGAKISFPSGPGFTVQSVTCSLPKCPNAADLQQGWPSLPLAAGTSTRFTVKIGVTAAAGTLALTANAAAPTGIAEANTANNAATLNARVVPLATNLQVTVTPQLRNSTPQARFRYEVNVKNAGPVDVINAVVTSPAVAGLTKLTVTPTCSSANNISSQGTATCPTDPTPTQIEQGIAIPEMRPGSSVNLSIEVLATTSATATLSAGAVLPPGFGDTAPADNTASATVATAAATAPGNTNLAVEMTSVFTVRQANQGLSYDVRVRNLGPAPGDGAIVRIPAVAGLKKLAVSCAPDALAGAQQLQSERPVCPASPTPAGVEQGVAIPRLPPGGSETFTVEAIATLSGNLALPASVTPAAGLTDPVPTNNDASITISAVGVPPPGNADVQVVITEMHKGPSTFGFQVHVGNAGPDAASFEVIRVPAVPGLNAVGVTCEASTGRFIGIQAKCPLSPTVPGLAAGVEIPELPAQTGLTFNIDLRTPTPPSTATLTATATAPPGGTDPSPANNTATLTASVP